MSCLARVYGSQTICAACGLNWDANDTEPPACGQIDRRTKLVRAIIKSEPTPIKRGLPDRLPEHLVQLMEKAYKANGMRAAYRVLLDEIGE